LYGVPDKTPLAAILAAATADLALPKKLTTSCVHLDRRARTPRAAILAVATADLAPPKKLAT